MVKRFCLEVTAIRLTESRAGIREAHAFLGNRFSHADEAGVWWGLIGAPTGLARWGEWLVNFGGYNVRCINSDIIAERYIPVRRKCPLRKVWKRGKKS